MLIMSLSLFLALFLCFRPSCVVTVRGRDVGGTYSERRDLLLSGLRRRFSSQGWGLKQALAVLGGGAA